MAVKLNTKNFDKSKALNNLVNKDKLTPHLIKGTMEEFSWGYDYQPKGEDDAWHPSGHCTPGVVELHQIATATDEERAKAQEKWLNMNRTFQVGHFWHQYYQIIVQRIGFAEEANIECVESKVWGYTSKQMPKAYHWVRGQADVAPCVIPRHGEFLVDFKTMGSHDYRRPGLPDWCRDKYEAQINIYMDLFDLDRGLIVCIQKDSPHNLKEFTFHRNQELIDAIYEKWEHVSHCLDEDIVPVDDDPKLVFTGPVEA